MLMLLSLMHMYRGFVCVCVCVDYNYNFMLINSFRVRVKKCFHSHVIHHFELTPAALRILEAILSIGVISN